MFEELLLDSDSTHPQLERYGLLQTLYHTHARKTELFQNSVNIKHWERSTCLETSHGGHDGSQASCHLYNIIPTLTGGLSSYWCILDISKP